MPLTDEIMNRDLAGYKIAKGYYLAKNVFCRPQRCLFLKASKKLILTLDLQLILGIKEYVEGIGVKIKSTPLFMAKNKAFFFDGIIKTNTAIEPFLVYDYNKLLKDIPKGWTMAREVFEWKSYTPTKF